MLYIRPKGTHRRQCCGFSQWYQRYVLKIRNLKFGLFWSSLKCSNAVKSEVKRSVWSQRTVLFSTGHLLDSFARAALWDSGLDYLHGTGHGVGCFLNVHEGPCGISYKTFADEPLEAGMIVSDGTETHLLSFWIYSL